MPRIWNSQEEALLYGKLALVLDGQSEKHPKTCRVSICEGDGEILDVDAQLLTPVFFLRHGNKTFVVEEGVVRGFVSQLETKWAVWLPMQWCSEPCEVSVRNTRSDAETQLWLLTPHFCVPEPDCLT